MSAKFVVSDTFNISGRGIVIAGKVLEGTIRTGMTCQVDGNPVKITGVEKFRKMVSEVNEGDQAGLLLKGAVTVKTFSANTEIVFEENAGSDTETGGDTLISKPVGFFAKLFGKG